MYGVLYGNSVHMSVTLVYCVETAASIEIVKTLDSQKGTDSRQLLKRSQQPTPQCHLSRLSGQRVGRKTHFWASE